MMIETILNFMDSDSNVKACVDLFQKQGCHSIYGIGGSVKPAVLAKVWHTWKKPLIVVTPSREQQSLWRYRITGLAVDFFRNLIDRTGYCSQPLQYFFDPFR